MEQTLAQLANETRDALGLTQQEMAARLGVGYRTYQSWEAGDAVPHDEDGVRRAIESIAAGHGGPG